MSTADRRSTFVPIAAALLGAVVLLLLTIPSSSAGAGTQQTAATLARRAEGTQTRSLAALANALQHAAPHGDIVRLSAPNGVTYGEQIQGPEARTTAGAQIRPAGIATRATLEVSSPAGATRDLTVVRGILIALCACALFALVLLAARSPARPAPLDPSHGMEPWAAVTAGGLSRTTRARTTADGNGGDASAAARDRAKLIDGLMAVIDLTPDRRVANRASRALDQVGVEGIYPRVGDPFDAQSHCVTGVVETSDDGLHDTVAGVVRAGYRERGRVVREADVQLYGAAAESEVATAPRRDDWEV